MPIAVEPTCERCQAEAELGRCEFCGRDLCVVCYDGDQEYTQGRRRCRLGDPLRDEAIRVMRQRGYDVDEIADKHCLSRRSVFRVLAKETA